MRTYERIYAIVRQIPPGQVATYGQVAELAGLIGKPRLVGYALYRVDMTLDDVPWQRVINAKGEVSYSTVRNGADYIQRAKLEDEGIEFNPQGRVDLKRYRWQPAPELVEAALARVIEGQNPAE
ncbi:MAG: methyltransferase [Leptolyngbyaceae cyanobacterium SM2_3_12]|nr:methyltransferase [Leptolyngbyaceae cyanobacterium SM2_3_12]